MASLLHALLRNESGGRNIANTTQGTSSGQAQGYFQITTGTWNEFGGGRYAPTPLQASYEQQADIASKIPLKRWDESTVAAMNATGKPIDLNRTLGENLSANGETLASGPSVTPTPGTSYTTQPGPLETTGRKGEEVWAQPETHARHPQNPQVGTGGYVAPGAPTTMPPGTIAPVTSIADAAALDKMNPWSSIGGGLASSVSNDTGLSSPDTAQLAAPVTDFASAIPPQAAAPDLPPGGDIGQLADLFKIGDFGQAAALNVDRVGQPIRRRQYG